MADPTLSDMYEYVWTELPGCSKILILKTTVEIIREWCDRTQAWEVDLNAIDIEDGTTEYDLQSHIPDTEIAGIVHRPGDANTDDVGVKWDGRLLSPGVEYTIPVDKDIIILDSEPTADDSEALTIKAALKPIRAATASMEIPERLFNDHHQVWARGIMSRLMLQKNKEWTDLETGRLYHNMYWDGIRLAITERTRGRTHRSLRVRHPAAFA